MFTQEMLERASERAEDLIRNCLHERRAQKVSTMSERVTWEKIVYAMDGLKTCRLPVASEL